jgi:glycosyltransferase involved in cell wall biosynthesis
MSRTVLHVQKVAGISGSEAHLLSLLPRLKERGWDVRFLMLHQHEPGAWEFADALESRGVPLDAIPMRADVDPIAFMRFVGYVARMRPAILHTHLVHADAYGQIVGLLTDLPVRLSTKHGFNEFREGRVFALGDRLIAAAADAQISISRGLARYLVDTEGFAEGSFEIVHYGIDAGPEPPPYPDGPPHFLCIGRLIPIKGHVVLLRAFRDALAERPDLVLDIAGRGVLDAGLKAVARELGIERSVNFLGHVSPVARRIELSAAVVVPSIGEGFGMVALEAMERARPVIATEIGGLIDIVRHGETGLLVPVAQTEPLTEAMLQLANDPETARAMGEAARLRALTRFPEARCTDRTAALYADLLDGRSDHSFANATDASSASRKSHGAR